MTARGLGAAFRHFESASTTPAIDDRAMRALLRGVTPKDVAELYGVNLRTAYRWRRDLVAVESVCVDGWVATFARRRDKPPARISEWSRLGYSPVDVGAVQS